MAETTKLSNPAAVGLAGFGGTTLLLQFHNLGWCSSGPVFWMAIFFGGLAQLVAGLQEFKTGNNFGYAVFCTYGAFWLALAGIMASSTYGWLNITAIETGYFLVIFTLLTCIYTLGALKLSLAHSITFVTLVLGFVGLDISHLGGPAVFTKIAAVVLIGCALSAWYMMAHVVLSELGWKLPLGSPVIGAVSQPRPRGAAIAKTA